MTKSIADRAAPVAELTLRGIVLGGLITLGFTAANVYLGLKIGLTFATSIPAAVISMAILRFFKGATILENNIVQTVASAAGTLAAIIFVLPGLVMVGWWQGFPFVTTAAITMTGGMLGVLFSVPLRRALVTGTDLPYPEGRAAAEVLIVGDSADGGEENRRGLWILVWNSLASAGFAALTQTKLAVAEASVWFRVGAGATGISGGLSFALLGAGHLVGLSVGIAQLVGLTIGWLILLPIMTAAHPIPGDVETWANTIFRSDVRFFGAGVIAVAAIWSLVRIIGPVIAGIRSSLAATAAARSGEALAIEEQDMPIGLVALLSLALLVPIGWVLWEQIAGGPLQGAGLALIAGGLLFVVVIGLVIAAVCGYMAALIGASNSPVSGVGILAIIASSLMLVGLFGRDNPPDTTAALVAFALVATGVVFGVATISNDNLQDLKTGQLVGATPWKQQVALMIGVVFGSLVIPPVLGALNTAFGFAGMPGAGPQALAAPQAALISALAKGVLGGDLNWAMIGYGALTGLVVIVADEVLRVLRLMRLPPLAVGIGVYLPMSITLTLVLGAVFGRLYDNWAKRTGQPEFAERMGVLTATGMIVGESLFGVVFAGIVGASGSDSPLALVGDGFGQIALVGGTIVFLALTGLLYRRTRASVAAIG